MGGHAYIYVGLPSLVNNPLVPTSTLMNSHTADPSIRKRGNLIHSTATWMSMLVVILKVLFGGLGYGTLQPHYMHASAPRLNYMKFFAFIIICK